MWTNEPEYRLVEDSASSRLLVRETSAHNPDPPVNVLCMLTEQAHEWNIDSMLRAAAAAPSIIPAAQERNEEDNEKKRDATPLLLFHNPTAASSLYALSNQAL